MVVIGRGCTSLRPTAVVDPTLALAMDIGIICVCTSENGP